MLAFLSDFGSKDPYVGIVKAVLLGINPALHIIDITHQIAPQDIMGGAFVLGSVFRQFPSGSIFLVVVDPGVGSKRAGLLATTRDYCFLAPDNGILTMIFRHSEDVCCYSIENSRYFRHPVSNTFHARDIFAPVAAHLSLGIEPSSFGPLCTDPVRLTWPEPVVKDEYIKGKVIYIDGFGNLVLNIPADLIPYSQNRQAKVRIRGIEIPLLRTYSDVPISKTLALIGSSGFLEIAVNQGSAAELLGTSVGEPVVIL
ncbi:MAG: hypothetical protein GWP10_03445 [Nitrospiraceae bacterium]|nr:hypothetical protein [Nitrospiraceae bacterium]